MDYDKTDMAPAYDAGRTHAPEVARRGLDLVAAHATPAGVSTIVDLGCGTGRFSFPLAD